VQHNSEQSYLHLINIILSSPQGKKLQKHRGILMVIEKAFEKSIYLRELLVSIVIK